MSARDPRDLPRVDPSDAEEGEEEGFDAEKFKDLAGFIARAPRRHPKLAAAIFVVVAGLGLAVAATMPRTYSAELKLLAQRNLVLPALSNPNRTVPRDADNPTKDVAVMIMRRDNLIALAKQADLVDRADSTRPAALRLKDRIFQKISGPVSDADKLRGFVGTLEKKLTVTADDTSVTIAIDWNDPQMAYELLTLVEKNFLEARYDADVAMITDAIGVLREHANTELAQVDAALAEFADAQAEQAKTAGNAPPSADGAAQKAPATIAARPAMVYRNSAPTTAAGSAAAPSAAAAQVDPDLAKALEEKRRQIKALDAERTREMDAMRQQLAQARLTLTPLHPTVQALQQKIDALNEPSPELASLQTEEHAIMAQIVAATPAPAAAPTPASSAGGAPGKAPVAAYGAPAPAAAQAARATYIPPASQTDSGPTQLARSKLETAIHRYQDVMARIDSANIELEITRTAFKYRYSVITPAEVPRSPKKPIATLVGIGSFIAGIFLALAATAALDFFGGRFIETWQVKRALKIDVLGEFEPPA